MIIRLKPYSLFIIICLIFNTLNLNGQAKQNEPEKISFADRLVFGGSLGLQFGTVTAVDVSPVAGFYFNRKLLWSLGLTYQYYREKYYNTTWSANIFGGRTGLTYSVINLGQNTKMKSDFSIFTHAEYELLNLDRDFSDYRNVKNVDRFWLQGVLLGGGLRQGLGKNSSFSITILYNILADERTPYDNPVLRIGFLF